MVIPIFSNLYPDYPKFHQKEVVDRFSWQHFLYKRFFLLAPKAIECKPVSLIWVDRVDKLQTSLLVCRGRRWFRAKWSDTPQNTLHQVIDDDASFNFRPYSLTSAGVLPNLFYTRHSGPTSLRSRSSVSVWLKNLAVILAPNSLPTRSKNGDSLTAHNPHQFTRQFGLDQRAVVETVNIYIDIREADTPGWVETASLTTSFISSGPPWPSEGFYRQAKCCTRRGALKPLRSSSYPTASCRNKSRCPLPSMSEIFTFVPAGTQGVHRCHWTRASGWWMLMGNRIMCL